MSNAHYRTARLRGQPISLSAHTIRRLSVAEVQS